VERTDERLDDLQGRRADRGKQNLPRGFSTKALQSPGKLSLRLIARVTTKIAHATSGGDQVTSSGTREWNIELTIEICPVKPIGAKAIEEYESGSSFDRRHIPWDYTSKRAITLSPRGNPGERKVNCSWMVSNGGKCLHKALVYVAQDSVRWSDCEEETCGSHEGFNISGKASPPI
jgi:hypothetical protein